MPSSLKRVNLTLEPDVVQALELYMRARGVRHYALAVYSILWREFQDRGYLYSGGSNTSPEGGE